MAEVLNVKAREGKGKRHSKHLRGGGLVPAVLYGHNEGTKSITVNADEIRSALRHGSKLVELQGDVNESALIRELQWDTYGSDILHVDFTRVSKDERIDVNVTVELRGDAPGSHAGGVVEHVLHELHVECLATSIPEKIQIKINALKLHDAIHAGQIELPEGVKLLTDADAVVVHCVPPVADVDTEAGLDDGAEPEVIGRKEEPEDEE